MAGNDVDEDLIAMLCVSGPHSSEGDREAGCRKGSSDDEVIEEWKALLSADARRRDRATHRDAEAERGPASGRG